MNRTKERHLIFAIIALVVVTIGFFAYLLYQKVERANVAPVIMCASDEISISVKATKEDLLTGVTAVDAEDGDITDRIVVESISSIVENGKCTITYAVSDSGNKVSSTSRTVHFTDYHAPVFEVTDDFIYTVGEKVEPLKSIKAYDCFDGDITSKISMVNISTAQTGSALNEVEFRVSNNYGDTSTLRANIVTNEKNTQDTPVINLSTYLIYVDEQSPFDPLSYVSEIRLDKEKFTPMEYGADKLYAEDPTAQGDPAVRLGEGITLDAGSYQIPIYCENGDHIGNTVLFVIVESPKA